jgi:hypothetical protein
MQTRLVADLPLARKQLTADSSRMVPQPGARRLRPSKRKKRIRRIARHSSSHGIAEQAASKAYTEEKINADIS